MAKQLAVLLYDVGQAPELIPNIIPQGTEVEVLRKVKHKDFVTGIGYIIFWEEKAYADCVDQTCLKFIY